MNETPSIPPSAINDDPRDNPRQSPHVRDRKFVISRLEPVRYRDQLYGKRIEFDHEKRQIRFESEFHAPAFLHYNQIAQIRVIYDPKKWLLWVGLLLLVLIVGIFLLLVRATLPPWAVRIELKHGEPVEIRARMDQFDADQLVQFFEGIVPCRLENSGKQ